MKYINFIILSFISIVISSCASQSYKELGNANFDIPKRKLNVEFYKQATNECGPISLFTITNYYNSPATIDEIKAMTYTPTTNGSHKSDMLAAARRLGFAAYKLNDITTTLNVVADNKPVLVFQNLGLSFRPKWHYSVLVGYDVSLQEVSLHDGKEAFSKVTFKRFANSWERGDKWAYAITPANIIPKQASLEQVLSNAQVFIDIDNDGAAFELLNAAKQKWPKHYQSYTQLSNLYFKRSDYSKAIEMAKSAIEYNSSQPGLYFNLAYIQINNKQKEEALISKANALRLVTNEDEKIQLVKRFESIGL